MLFIFNIDPFLSFFAVSDVIQGPSPSLPLDDFPGKDDFVSFRDAIRHK